MIWYRTGECYRRLFQLHVRASAITFFKTHSKSLAKNRVIFPTGRYWIQRPVRYDLVRISEHRENLQCWWAIMRRKNSTVFIQYIAWTTCDGRTDGIAVSKSECGRAIKIWSASLAAPTQFSVLFYLYTLCLIKNMWLLFLQSITWRIA